MFVLSGTIYVLLVQKECARLFGGLVHQIRSISRFLPGGVLGSQQVLARFVFAAGRNHVRNRKDDHDSAFSFSQDAPSKNVKGRM